ncbi:MAG: SDR family oxidoreductase [Candidatus Hodarchaeales archaeon]|jgi:uncharacterized protein YbjT (DUF2867 family)
MTISDESILVLGGTGHYGQHVVNSLVKLNQPVKVVSRNPEKAKKVLNPESNVIKGDITKSEDLEVAIKDIKAIVISISAFNWRTVRKIHQIEKIAVQNVLQMAELAGIDRIVYVSVYDIIEEFVERISIPQAVIKQEIEEYLVNSELKWTILGAAPSIDIFFSMIRGTTMMVPGGGPPALPTVSPIDFGEICAQAIIRNDVSGKRFRLTGPYAYSFPEVAEKISDMTGKHIKFRKIPTLPLRVISLFIKPFNPYLWHLSKFVRLLNDFPQELVAEVGKDHNILTSTFDYSPRTLEWHIEEWARNQRQKNNSKLK